MGRDSARIEGVGGHATTVIGAVSGPLKTTLYSLMGELPETIRAKLLETVSWRNREQWRGCSPCAGAPAFFTTGTRSLCIGLSPEETDFFRPWATLPVVAMQLKGLIYIPSRVEGLARAVYLNDIRVPNEATFEEHQVFFNIVNDQGRISRQGWRKDTPCGAQLWDVIERSIKVTQTGASRNLITPLSIGYGLFEELRYKGHRTGFLVSGVYDRWNARLLDFFSTLSYVSPHLPSDQLLTAPHPICAELFGEPGDFFARAAPREANRFMSRFTGESLAFASRLFRLYGRGIAEAHAKQIVFYNPHIENVLPVGGKLVLYDWEHSRDISVEPPPRQVGYCALDLLNLFDQFFIILRVADKLGLLLLEKLASERNLCEQFLLGYGLHPADAGRIGAGILEQGQIVGRCGDAYVERELAPALARRLFS